MKDLIITTIIALIVLLAWLGNEHYNRVLGTEVELIAKPIVLTANEVILQDKIVIQKQDYISVNEWREELPNLLNKMRLQAKMTEAQFLNNYYKKSANFVIQDLGLKIKEK